MKRKDDVGSFEAVVPADERGSSCLPVVAQADVRAAEDGRVRSYAEIEAREDEEHITRGVAAVLHAREAGENPKYLKPLSVCFLQRRLRWGYARASRLCGEIQLRADLGPSSGANEKVSRRES